MSFQIIFYFFLSFFILLLHWFFVFFFVFLFVLCIKKFFCLLYFDLKISSLYIICSCVFFILFERYAQAFSSFFISWNNTAIFEAFSFFFTYCFDKGSISLVFLLFSFFNSSCEVVFSSGHQSFLLWQYTQSTTC